MSKIIPPPVPAVKPKLESFNSFYSTLPDGSRQKPIPFPRTSLCETLKRKEISTNKECMKDVIQKLAKFKIYIEFEDITELEYTRRTKDYSNNILNKKRNLIRVKEDNYSDNGNSISSAPTTPNLHSPPAFVLDPANLIYLVPNPVNSKLADVLKPMTKCYRSTMRKGNQFTGI
uniref:Uncharacterized protein n=1 Tax=Strongyloides venezuelensis TaxID=75913 RepID=A0A0K0G3V8_STRVS